MNSEIYRYHFKQEVAAQQIKETLHLALVAAESLHGQARVRLDVSYCLDIDRRICVIDASSAVGQDVVRIFTGLTIREFGEDSFQVGRVDLNPNYIGKPCEQ